MSKHDVAFLKGGNPGDFINYLIATRSHIVEMIRKISEIENSLSGGYNHDFTIARAIQDHFGWQQIPEKTIENDLILTLNFIDDTVRLRGYKGSVMDMERSWECVVCRNKFSYFEMRGNIVPTYGPGDSDEGDAGYCPVCQQDRAFVFHGRGYTHDPGDNIPKFIKSSWTWKARDARKMHGDFGLEKMKIVGRDITDAEQAQLHGNPEIY